MPVLGGQRETKKVILDDDQNGEVELYTNATIADVAHLTDDTMSEGERLVKLLPKLIKSWNYTDENEVLLEINDDNVGKLSAKSLNKLVEVINIDEDAKKN